MKGDAYRTIPNVNRMIGDMSRTIDDEGGTIPYILRMKGDACRTITDVNRMNGDASRTIPYLIRSQKREPPTGRLYRYPLFLFWPPAGRRNK